MMDNIGSVAEPELPKISNLRNFQTIKTQSETLKKFKSTFKEINFATLK